MDMGLAVRKKNLKSDWLYINLSNLLSDQCYAMHV